MNKDNPRANEQKTAQQKDQTEVAPAVVPDAANNKPDKANKDERNPQQTQKDDRRDAYTPSSPSIRTYLAIKTLQEYSALSTVGISFIALVLIFWQGCVLERQTDLTEKTWNEMRQTREVENRAWVGVKPAFYASRPNEGLISIQMAFTNTGNVPATATGIINGQCLAQSPPNDVTYGQPMTLPSQMTLMPGAEFPHTVAKLKAFPYCGKEPPPSMKTQGVIVEDLETAPAYFYLYGKINYDDLFGSHETLFCFFSLPSVREQQPTFASCPTHNTFK